jgi:hypothetical protein
MRTRVFSHGIDLLVIICDRRGERIVGGLFRNDAAPSTFGFDDTGAVLREASLASNDSIAPSIAKTLMEAAAASDLNRTVAGVETLLTKARELVASGVLRKTRRKLWGRN